MRNSLHYFLLFVIATIGIINAKDDICSCTNFSHSYFSVRPQFQISSPEYTSLARSFRNARQDGHGIGVQAVVFGGRSTDRNGLGTYFSPVCDSSFTVDGAVEVNTENIFPQNFNLFSVGFSPQIAALLDVTPSDPAFSSIVKLKPQQSVIGLGLVYQHEFCFFDRYHWISISGPVVRAQNTMGLEEDIQQAGQFFNVTPLVNETTNLDQNLRSMQEALVQDDWNFGKIDNQKRRKTRLAFVQIQVGSVVVDNECCHFEPYVGVTIPTGNKPKAEYVFEPIVGNGNHFGVLWGAAGGMQVWQSDCYDVVVDFETETTMQYLFKKTHKRSVDLRNKPWSRYIETYADSNQAAQANGLGSPQAIFLATPGINLLTQDVEVNPGFNLTSNMAFVFTHCPGDSGFDAELGYNFYAREAECLSLKETFSTTAAIKDHVGRGVTNPVRDITGDQLLNEASVQNLVVNGQFNALGIAAAYDRGIITQSDLNLASAAHPCVIAHTVYGSMGYHCNAWCYPVMASVGGSYEFNRKSNATMDRWLVWGKLGISF